jgi:hypothetical protein
VTNKNKLQSDKISEFFQNPERVTAVLQQGIRDALLKHKQAGNSVCTWKNGKVIWIAPEEIPVFPNNKSSSA